MCSKVIKNRLLLVYQSANLVWQARISFCPPRRKSLPFQEYHKNQIIAEVSFWSLKSTQEVTGTEIKARMTEKLRFRYLYLLSVSGYELQGLQAVRIPIRDKFGPFDLATFSLRGLSSQKVTSYTTISWKWVKAPDTMNRELRVTGILNEA